MRNDKITVFGLFTRRYSRLASRFVDFYSSMLSSPAFPKISPIDSESSPTSQCAGSSPAEYAHPISCKTSAGNYIFCLKLNPPDTPLFKASVASAHDRAGEARLLQTSRNNGSIETGSVENAGPYTSSGCDAEL